MFFFLEASRQKESPKIFKLIFLKKKSQQNEIKSQNLLVPINQTHFMENKKEKNEAVTHFGFFFGCWLVRTCRRSPLWLPVLPPKKPIYLSLKNKNKKEIKNQSLNQNVKITLTLISLSKTKLTQMKLKKNN